MRHLIVLCLLVPLTGCGLFVSKQTRALRATPEYRDGYNDGCQSAAPQDANMRQAATRTRDDQLYESNKAYRAGWGAGFGACRSYTPQNMPAPDAGPLRDPQPGNGTIP